MRQNMRQQAAHIWQNQKKKQQTDQHNSQAHEAISRPRYMWLPVGTRGERGGEACQVGMSRLVTTSLPCTSLDLFCLIFCFVLLPCLIRLCFLICFPMPPFSSPYDFSFLFPSTPKIRSCPAALLDFWISFSRVLGPVDNMCTIHPRRLAPIQLAALYPTVSATAIMLSLLSFVFVFRPRLPFFILVVLFTVIAPLFALYARQHFNLVTIFTNCRSQKRPNQIPT